MIRTALAGVVIAAVLAPAALAADWKFDPKARPKAKAGQKKTEEGETNQKEKSSISVEAEGESREVKKEDKEDKVVFKLQREVKKAEDGKATEESIKIEQWVRTATGEPEDRCLEGQTLIVTKGAEGKTYKIVDEKEGAISDGARAWIEEYYAKKKKKNKKDDAEDDDEGPGKFLPQKPISDGEEWTGDPEALAKDIFGEEGLIDPARSSVKGKLSGVKVVDGLHHGVVEVTIKLKLKSLPNMPKEMAFEWTKGGEFNMTVTIDGCLELEKLGGGTYKIGGELKGEAKFNAQGQNASLKMSVKQKIAVKSTPDKEKSEK